MCRGRDRINKSGYGNMDKLYRKYSIVKSGSEDDKRAITR
jgi:hypothetical protein